MKKKKDRQTQPLKSTFKIGIQTIDQTKQEERLGEAYNHIRTSKYNQITQPSH